MDETIYRSDREPLVSPGAIECHVRDMTATMSADVRLSQVQAELAQHGQWLPIDGDTGQTIGALVSVDSTGPLRLGYGAWRDLLLGAQFTNGRDQLITAGGRTVKNVAGYDLTKFIVGQRGVFARPLTLTSRTYRLPVGAIVARHLPDARRINRLMPTSLRPQWAVLTQDALWCGYLGDETTLAYYRSAIAASEPMEVRELLPGGEIDFRGGLWNLDGPFVFRASIPPARLGELSRQLSDIPWAADAAFGIIIGTLESEASAAAIRQAVSEAGGTLKLSRGRFGSVVELSTTPGERQIIERLKRAFDPEQKLNPLPWPHP